MKQSEPILHQKTFQELTTNELYELLRVRSEVFVVEQNCVYQDLDGDDQKSIHLWLTVAGKIVALARVCPAGTHMKEISIGRVITTERGRGYGKLILLHAIDAAIEHFGATLIDIEAQEYAKGFYERVGFKQSSESFMLDGIPHIKMTWCKQDNMRWTVLSDNRSDDSRLSTEHGLSILMETEWHKILLDTGASDVFIKNAELLGIDLSDVDYVFISHGHSDHAGGLRYFLEHNQKAQVIVSPEAMIGKFFSKRGNLHSITTEWPEIDRNRLVLIDQTCEILEGLHVIAHIPQIHPMPKGNQNLYVQDANGDYIHDNFRHELALYVDGLLFMGCAHSGLENILAACPWPIHSVVGGFHLLDGQETDDEIKALAQRLKAKYPETQFYTSHCTGDNVFEVMKDMMGEQLQSFRCGTKIALEK